MALSDSCFEFLHSVEEAARTLAEEVHYFSAPDYPIEYGVEIDALRQACLKARATPDNPDAIAALMRLAASVMKFHDTPPIGEASDAQKKEMLQLIRLLQGDLGEEDAKAVPEIVKDAVAEDASPEAANRLKGYLSKVGRDTYDAATRILTAIGTEALKRMLDL
ncbi:hypothetical protein [Methylocystis sp. JR02]|uniref:hypothetical protein n=1 Tax=Methylocystis sp. JR02 TaxID=3046284 RepID=UPI0024BB2E48|nr:hypothetical protein [Methylocystis sp. JR02]MDJ0450502.1 hypothetical protein [Methylocystis sp. JR02]